MKSLFKDWLIAILGCIIVLFIWAAIAGPKEVLYASPGERTTPAELRELGITSSAATPTLAPPPDLEKGDVNYVSLPIALCRAVGINPRNYISWDHGAVQSNSLKILKAENLEGADAYGIRVTRINVWVTKEALKALQVAGLPASCYD